MFVNLRAHPFLLAAKNYSFICKCVITNTNIFSHSDDGIFSSAAVVWGVSVVRYLKLKRLAEVSDGIQIRCLE
jgi:hypothetical protein